jgi:hypothetical protein
MRPEAGSLRVIGADQCARRNAFGKNGTYSWASFPPKTHYHMTGIWRKKSAYAFPEASGLIARISSSSAVYNIPCMDY